MQYCVRFAEKRTEVNSTFERKNKKNNERLARRFKTLRKAC